MISTPKIAAARIKVEKRRAALMATAHELQYRLQPRTLASEAWEKAKVKGADFAEEAVEAVARRPAAVGGVAAAIALFLAREPIKDTAVKIYDAMTLRKAAKLVHPALTTVEKPERPVGPGQPRARPAKHATSKTEIMQ